MSAGSIIVEFLAKTGTFETDTARASNALKKMQRDAEATMRAFKASFAGNLLSDLTQQIVSFAVKLPAEILASVAAFKDLKEATGASIENISALDRIARETGRSFDTVGLALINLNKSINAATPGSAAESAINAIGLSVKDLKALDPADALLKVSIALNGFADDGNKARLTQELFKKTLREVAPLLKDVAEKGALNATTTTSQAEAVEAYRKQSFALKADLDDLARTIFIDLIPQLRLATQLTKELFGAKPGNDTLSRRIKDAELDLKNEQERFTAGAGEGIFDILLYGDKETRQRNLDASKQRMAKAKADYQALVGTSTAGAGRGFGMWKPSVADFTVKLPGTGTDDPSKKIFENQLKALEAFVTQEKDLYATRNTFLDLYNSQSLLSLSSYFDARQVILDASVSAETSTIDKEIALAKKRKGAPGVSAKDQEDAQGKIEELVRRRSKIEQDAGAQGIELAIKRAQAEEELRKVFAGVEAQVLDLNEAFSAAAAIKFDLQNDALLKTFTKEGNVAGQAAIKMLRDAAIAQADFAKASLDASRTLTELSNAEERLTLAEQTGAITGLEGLVKLGAARRAIIPILEAEVAANEAIAKASGIQTLIDEAEKGRLALDKLKASADPLAESLNKAFGSDLNSALDDFVTGTKSASDAFHAFATSVLNDILKMGSKSIAESLIGGSGGAGGLISSLFSGSSGNVQGIGDKYNGSSASGGVGLASLFASLFSGMFADGGYIAPGKVGIVGENGPEWAFGGRTGQTIQPPGGNSRTQNISVNVQASQGISRQTAQQQGRDIGVGIRQALARND